MTKMRKTDVVNDKDLISFNRLELEAAAAYREWMVNKMDHLGIEYGGYSRGFLGEFDPAADTKPTDDVNSHRERFQRGDRYDGLRENELYKRAPWREDKCTPEPASAEHSEPQGTTDPEKVIIDAKREGWVAGAIAAAGDRRKAGLPWTEWLDETTEAAKRFPYPKVTRVRRVRGAAGTYEVRRGDYEMVWMCHMENREWRPEISVAVMRDLLDNPTEEVDA